MQINRRHLLGAVPASALAYAALPALAAPARAQSAATPLSVGESGPLLALPEGFSYTLIAETGTAMSDRFLRPGRPDGMACYADPASPQRVTLMSNHENFLDVEGGSPFGEHDALLARLPEDKLYDRKNDGRPFIGGVSRTVYDMAGGRIIEDNLALVGTVGNCAGGRTPWGSWLSCEEQMLRGGDEAPKPHGFVFEVPSGSRSVVTPEPLTAMGRFTHEAAIVDPVTGIVYMTEDHREGLFYRFLPNTNGELAKGGRLQALAIMGWPSASTTNWPRDWGGAGLGSVTQGQDFQVEWIDMDDVEAPDGDLRLRGHAAGAALFCRGEGIDYAVRADAETGELYFNCTQGGNQRCGQVWRYRPGTREGQSDEASTPGTLTLVYESPGGDVLDLNDNIAVAPWGDLILCEDGMGDNHLRGLTRDGRIYDIARNAHEGQSEFCGACFAPDGKTMFVNIQNPGYMLAITGPWRSIRGG